MGKAQALKILLLVAAAAVAVWLLLAVDDQRQLRISPTQPPALTRQPAGMDTDKLAATASATTVLVKPRYTGEDQRGYAWELTADSAAQAGTMASSSMVLTRVQATWQQGQTYTLQAASGDYDMQAKTLNLQGDVRLEGQGLTLALPEATADLVTRDISGQGGIALSGRLGGYDATLTAPTFNLSNQASHLAFSGPVHVELRE